MNAFRAAASVAACCLAMAVAAADRGARADGSVSPMPAAVSQAPTPLTAEQIVDKSVAVRGGLEAWRKIDSIIWTGRLESTRSPVPSLPFKLEQKRPNKSRFEINEPSQRSMRVFDGITGWKMRKGEDGRPDVKRFTPQEVQFARDAPGLEGPLIDFRAKGGSVELEGPDDIDGRKAYRIGLRLASGERQSVWVDAETFLEIRYDRTVHGRGGAAAMVSVHYRDYKEVESLAVPSVIEISGAGGGKPDRMTIDKVALNPMIDDREFGVQGDSRGRRTPGPGGVAK